MSAIPSISQAGISLQSAWDRIGQRVGELSTQIANGDTGDGSFVNAVVELKSLEIQAKAAGMVFHTLDQMASDLLQQPRK